MWSSKPLDKISKSSPQVRSYVQDNSRITPLLHRVIQRSSDQFQRRGLQCLQDLFMPYQRHDRVATHLGSIPSTPQHRQRSHSSRRHRQQALAVSTLGILHWCANSIQILKDGDYWSRGSMTLERRPPYRAHTRVVPSRAMGAGHFQDPRLVEPLHII